MFSSWPGCFCHLWWMLTLMQARHSWLAVGTGHLIAGKMLSMLGLSQLMINSNQMCRICNCCSTCLSSGAGRRLLMLIFLTGGVVWTNDKGFSCRHFLDFSCCLPLFYMHMFSHLAFFSSCELVSLVSFYSFCQYTPRKWWGCAQRVWPYRPEIRTRTI